MEFLPNSVNGYQIKRTCDCCPEQYDVFDSKGKQIAYIRERWENLTVECPDCGGDLVFEAGLTSSKSNVKAFKKEIFESIDRWRSENENN